MILKDIGRAKSSVLRSFGLEPMSNTHATSNGEYAFLRYLKALPEAATGNSIIDVGANVGDWTSQALKAFGALGISTFYCIEPIPTFSSRLKARFRDDSRVKVLDIALSSEGGKTVPIFEIAGGGRMYQTYRGTILPVVSSPDEGSSSKRKKVHIADVSTGDAIFSDSGINPYFIKIDCDGHDCHVLKGFSGVIAARRPIVQFEYCDLWIAAGARLREACEILYRSKYKTFKMFPDGLRRFQYNAVFETFSYQNIVAIPAENLSSMGKTISFAN